MGGENMAIEKTSRELQGGQDIARIAVIAANQETGKRQ